MPELISTIRDNLITFSRTLTSDILALAVLFFLTFSVGIAVTQQALIPALVGSSGYKALMLAIPVFLFPTQGIVLPYVLVQDRPRARLLFLTVLFLAAVTSYLVFLGEWWRSLEDFIEAIGFFRAGGTSSEIGTALRYKFLPQIFSAFLKDMLLGAYCQCLLWEAIRRRKPSAPSVLTGARS